MITGRVHVKETSIGIPNLLIVVYDTDQNKIKRIDLRATGTRASTVLRGFWAKFPGNRLGSTSTNQNGEFKIAYEYNPDKQTTPKTKKRPSLALFVLGPEESDSLVNQQLLYQSKEVREKSGRLENYIIQIPQAKLDSKKIPYPKPDNLSTITNSIKTKIENSAELNKTIKTSLNSQVSKQYQLFSKFSKKSKESLKDFSLSSLSSEEKSDHTYLNLTDDLKKNQVAIIERDLKKISQAPNLPMKLTMSESEIANFGLTLNPDKTITGSTDYYNINSKLRDTLIEYLDSTVNSSPFESCRKNSEMDDKIEEIKNPFDGSSTDSEESTDSDDAPLDSTTNTHEDIAIENHGKELTTEEFIKERSIQYMNYSPLISQSDDVQRADASKIVSTLSKFKLETGPADVESYHDFYSLQLNFESVKTEVFDETIAPLASNFLTAVSNYVSTIAIDSLDESNPSILNSSDLKNNIRDAMVRAASIASIDTPSVGGIDNMTITNDEWDLLTTDEKARIIKIDDQIDVAIGEYKRKSEGRFGKDDPDLLHEIKRLKDEGRSIIDTVISINTRVSDIERQLDILSNRKSGIPLISDLNKELEDRLKQPYKFDIFAPNSVNFGLLVNYRQKWDPINYQVGELVSTIPLAPKETRKYTKKQIVKKKRSEKEIENSVQSVKDESQNTSRADAEIIDKTEKQHSFKLSVSPSGFIKKFVDVTSEYSFDKKKLSQKTKKSFRESVRKASEEYKNEHKLEVSTEQSLELEQTESGEISNPNDELPVTYLFYELQRRYKISEKIHKVTPIILVANKVPKPNEIDEDWLVTHDWILKRAILDDSFLVALDNLQIISDIRIAITDLNEQIINQESVIHNLQLEVNNEKAFVITSREELTDIQEERPTDERRIDTYRDIFQRNEQKLQEITSRLDTEVKNLHKLKNELNISLRKYSELSISISRLKVHIKIYILHYMQAIWNYEPSDQRFFRLYDIQVPWFDEPASTASVPIESTSTKGDNNNLFDIFTSMISPETNFHRVGVSFPVPKLSLPLNLIPYKKLGDIADLEHPLGYFGNYMIFPLKEINYLLTFMMKDYVDLTHGGLVDPDETGNFSTEDMIDYIKCLYEKNPETFKEDDWDKFKNILSNYFNPNEPEEIIVPTDSMYIEALPGTHPILENFKLTHRAIDTNKAKSELIKSELENMRLAARLLSKEYDDPDIEKQILISDNKNISPVIDVDDSNSDENS